MADYKPGDRLAVLIEKTYVWFDQVKGVPLYQDLGSVKVAGKSGGMWVIRPDDEHKLDGLYVVELTDRRTPMGNLIWKLVEAN